MLDEQILREQICRWGRSMFERGLTSGSSGNLSARLPDGFLTTPTNSCLGFLDPDRLSKLDLEGNHIGGDKPTKEVPLHLAFYRARPKAGGVVHLHSTYATALSCLSDTDEGDAVPAYTPYVVMRVGKVPLILFTLPGSSDTSTLVERAAQEHSAVLLANHGPVVSGPSFEAAVFAAEELEEAAKLYFVLQGHRSQALTGEQIADLGRLSLR
jgi:ribulose-5-phosphate 4-epimerase/fuculose-1-phosphate aldolase